MRVSETEIRESARKLGLYCDTHAPGDGVRRYRFFDRPSDYHGPWNGIYTALGSADADTFLTGYAQGFAAKAKNEGSD